MTDQQLKSFRDKAHSSCPPGHVTRSPILFKPLSTFCRLKPNTHRRRRRDETVLSRRVGVGGVYMNSRRLPTDSNAQHSRRRPVYNSGLRLPAGVFAPTTQRNCRQLVANSCTHRRRDSTVSSRRRRRCVLGIMVICTDTGHYSLT